MRKWTRSRWRRPTPARRSTTRVRGVGTFLPIADYPFYEWRRPRSQRTAVVELAVFGGVRDIVDHTIVVESRQGNAVPGTLWQR
jgi:hypothetical protein